MTPAQLRTILSALLTDLLGTYTFPGAATKQPAINVGQPHADITATGLECIINPDKSVDSTPLLNNEVEIHEAIHVRLVKHGSGAIGAAARRIHVRFPEAVSRTVPANVEAGILESRTIIIPNP